VLEKWKEETLNENDAKKREIGLPKLGVQCEASITFDTRGTGRGNFIGR